MNQIRINNTWNNLVKVLTANTDKPECAVNFLTAGYFDANKIAEISQFPKKNDSILKERGNSSGLFYNPARIPLDDRKTIVSLNSDYWELREYLRKCNHIDMFETIRERIHTIHESVFPKYNRNLSTNVEIMRILYVILSNLPEYVSKQKLIQKNQHQGLYYISRNSCVDEIERLLTDDKNNCVVIAATAGMGKKMVALEYAGTYKDANVIFLTLPTDNISLEQQISDGISESKLNTVFLPSNSIDISELLDLDNTIIIIERVILDSDDYSYIQDVLHFSKAKLIILTTGIKADVHCSIYQLPSLTPSSLWELFQNTINMKTSSDLHRNLISEDDFMTILEYSGNNTLVVTLFAKAVVEMNLDENNSETMRNLILKKNLPDDANVHLPYVSHSLAKNHRNRQPLENIINDILIPIAAIQNIHFFRFPDICFLVRGKCSCNVLYQIYDMDEIDPVINEMVNLGYAELTDDELCIHPFISDAIWNYHNASRSLDESLRRLDHALEIFKFNNMLFLRNDATYFYSILETVYNRIVSILPMIGSRESRKAGNVVELSWLDYWELILGVYVLSYKFGNYRLSEKVLYNLSSWKTAKEFKKAAIPSYLSALDLLRLLSTISLDSRNEILLQMDVFLNSKEPKSYKSDFLDSVYMLLFDSMFRYISYNLVMLSGFFDNPARSSIDHTLNQLAVFIERSTIPNDWKSYYNGYKNMLCAINRIALVNPETTQQEMAYAQDELRILSASTNDEIKLHATFLYDAGTVLYYSCRSDISTELLMSHLYPDIMTLLYSDIVQYGSYIENHMVSITLLELYSITRILYELLSGNTEGLSIFIPQSIKMLQTQTQQSIISDFIRNRILRTK